MLLIQNRQITRSRYENEKLSSDPSFSLQNEAMEIFLIFLNYFDFFSNPKPSLPILWTLNMSIGDSSFVWSLFHENDLHQVYIFFLITLSHMTAMCTRITTFWVFLNFLKTFELDFDRSLQKMIFQKNAPIPSLYFFMVTRSHKRTNYVCFIFLRFFLI